MPRRSGNTSGLRRVGLLTYHRSVNDGSIMQAYSLYQLLRRELPGAQIEIIDYMLGSLHERHRRLALYAHRPPFLNPRYIWSYLNQKSFLNSHCRLSGRRLVSDDYDEAQRFISAQGYDAIVMGSDNAWELGRAPLPPNAFFRPSATIPSFAFAPSADPAPVAGSPWVTGDKASLLKSQLDDFQIITARDDATRDFLGLLGLDSDRVGQLPDPTLLTDFSEHLAKPDRLGGGNQPLAALAAAPQLARKLHDHLRGANFEIVSLMGARQLEGAIAAPMLSTIQQRLGMYPFFDLTITDRFHMSIFALKHGRGPVIFLEDENRWPDANSKGRDLLTRLGLESMVWRVNDKDCSADKLRGLLDTWPTVSIDLADRLKALRNEAASTGYYGIIPALKKIIEA